MSTTKVLHVIARMNVGGTARYVGSLVSKIPESALATGYVQGAEIEDGVTDQIPIYRISHLGRRISLISDFKSWLELRDLVKVLKPEIIHTHTFKAGLIGRLVGRNHKHIHTFHGHLFGDQSFSRLETIVINRIERFLAARTDLLISVGEKVGNELRTEGIGTNCDWISISPGVSPLRTVERNKARAELGLEQNGILVGWMARMTSVKNPDLMLEVARGLPHISFVMAGGGDLLDRIQELAPPNVKVIGWTDAALFWSAVDCAISTSDNEGMPIALIEAQLAGVPVIATNVGSCSEVVQHQITGLITSNQTLELQIAVEKLATDFELREAMSTKAKEWSRHQFSPGVMLALHLDVYRRLAS
jgi:glycosyltransferase involved in cell wall biosynthesis